MQVISIINQKGGVGKTTTAHNIACGLRLQAKKVLLLDLDSQCNLTFALNTKSKNNIYDVLTGKIPINEAIINDFIAGSQHLVTLQNKKGAECILKYILQKLEPIYDYVIIDTPPALGIVTINALTASDYVIITTTSDIFAIQGIRLLTDTINAVKKNSNHNLKIMGILITRFNSRTVMGKSLRKSLTDIATKIGTKVFNTAIRESIAIREAQTKQMDIFSYARYSTAGRDYKNLINEIINEGWF